MHENRPNIFKSKCENRKIVLMMMILHKKNFISIKQTYKYIFVTFKNGHVYIAIGCYIEA